MGGGCVDAGTTDIGPGIWPALGCIPTGGGSEPCGPGCINAGGGLNACEPGAGWIDAGDGRDDGCWPDPGCIGLDPGCIEAGCTGTETGGDDGRDGRGAPTPGVVELGLDSAGSGLPVTG